MTHDHVTHGHAGKSDPARTDPNLAPGAWVRHPGRPDWGLGQVQSAIGARVTVNFEHVGKQMINAAVVALAVVDP